MVRTAGMTACLPGYEHINRFMDREHGKTMAKILPGEFYVTQQPEVIVTVLGSCVSACIRDRKRGIAGMNHFMLPMQQHESELSPLSRSARYGSWAMEMLINELLKAGAQRVDLEVKIFGGGRVLNGMDMIDIGRRNVEFVESYLALEGLPIVAQDTGDIYPRKLQFFTETGKVRVRKLEMLRNQTVAEREVRYRHQIMQTADKGTVELFGGDS